MTSFKDRLQQLIVESDPEEAIRVGRAHLQQAAELQENAEELAYAYRKLGELAVNCRRPDLGLQCFEDALVWADRMNDPTERAVVCNEHGKALRAVGQSREAVVRYTQGLAAAAQSEHRVVLEGNLRGNRGVALRGLGRYREALADLEAALETDLALDSDEIGISYNNLAELLEQMGDLPRAVRFHHYARRIAEREHNVPELVVRLSNLSQVHLRAGKPRRALRLVTRARDLATASGCDTCLQWYLAHNSGEPERPCWADARAGGRRVGTPFSK